MDEVLFCAPEVPDQNIWTHALLRPLVALPAWALAEGDLVPANLRERRLALIRNYVHLRGLECRARKACGRPEVPSRACHHDPIDEGIDTPEIEAVRLQTEGSGVDEVGTDAVGRTGKVLHVLQLEGSAAPVLALREVEGVL